MGTGGGPASRLGPSARPRWARGGLDVAEASQKSIGCGNWPKELSGLKPCITPASTSSKPADFLASGSNSASIEKDLLMVCSGGGGGLSFRVFWVILSGARPGKPLRQWEERSAAQNGAQPQANSSFWPATKSFYRFSWLKWLTRSAAPKSAGKRDNVAL